MLVDELDQKIEEAKAAGTLPFIVSTTCGTTVLGAFDPINDVADVCEKHKIWLHVDVSRLIIELYLQIIFISSHYITLSAFQTPPTPKVTSGASTIITCYTKYSPPASYTASQVRPKRKISCAAAQIAATQIAATLTISFPRWRHMSSDGTTLFT